MAEQESREGINLGETVSRAEDFFKQNKKLITYIGGGIAGLIILFLGWKYYIHSQDQIAQEQALGAIRYFEKDSLDLAIKGDGQSMGLEDLVDEYGLTPTGNLCYYYLGIAYYKKGKPQEAIEKLKKFSGSDNMVAATALNAIASAYEDLKDKDHAAAYYEKAAHEFENDATTPIYLMQAGRVYEESGDRKKALKIYYEIKNKYPNSTEGRDMDKYIAPIEAAMD